MWGQNLVEVITGSLARIVQKLGGIAAGAFDEEGTLQGLVFGFTGVRDGAIVHWSHMLAVRSGLRDEGLGRNLKLYQREALLARGINEVFWTYDPLVARNAHLNFNSLGVEVAEYVPDMYGPGDDSELFRGLGTDRFVVRWLINSSKVRHALQHVAPALSADCSNAPAMIHRSAGTDPFSAPQFSGNSFGRVVRIEIPPDIHAVRNRSVENAAAWRSMTREAFQSLLQKGYRVKGFSRDADSGRCYYCLNVAE